MSSNSEPFDLLLAQLNDGDWKVRANAVRRVVEFKRQAALAIERLFELIFDDHAPVSSYSAAVIRRLGVVCVPCLLQQARQPSPDRRAKSLELLGDLGVGRAMYSFATQELGPRRLQMPTWGEHERDVLALFHESLSDGSLDVRFAAAVKLEELGLNLEQTIPVFVEVLQFGESHWQKNFGAMCLGRIGPVAHSSCDALRCAMVSAGLPTNVGPEGLISRDPERRAMAARGSLAFEKAFKRIGCT